MTDPETIRYEAPTGATSGAPSSSGTGVPPSAEGTPPSAEGAPPSAPTGATSGATTGAPPGAGMGAPASPPPPPPAWRPPPSDPGRNAWLIIGVIIVIVGAWFFATRTLGLELPRLDWGQLWPVLLILLGAWIVLSAFRQRTR